MKKYGVLLFGILLIALAGCGSSEPETVEITLELTEFSFTPADIELKVGQIVTLTIVNNGTLQHEIMFGKEVMMMDGAANGFSVDMFEFAGVEPEGLELMSGDMDMDMDEDMDMDMDMDEDMDMDMDMDEDMDMDMDMDEDMDMDMDMDEDMDMDMDMDEDHDEDAMGEDEEHAMHSGYMTTVSINGGSATITFTVTEEMVGEWQFGCFLDAGTHFAQGMVGTLIITN